MEDESVSWGSGEWGEGTKWRGASLTDVRRASAGSVGEFLLPPRRAYRIAEHAWIKERVKYDVLTSIHLENASVLP